MVRSLKDGKFDAGYIAHPSLVTPEELKAITKPLSIAAAGEFRPRPFVFSTSTAHSPSEVDQIFAVSLRHESESILSKIGVPYSINLYGGVAHGFAVRGDLTVPNIKFAKEQAFSQAVAWLDHHL